MFCPEVNFNGGCDVVRDAWDYGMQVMLVLRKVLVMKVLMD